MRRRWVAATGLGAVLAYALGSFVTASLGAPDAPLLDGLSPPPPYRWVNPPPELESGNQAPEPGTFTLDLNRKGSTAGAFSTPDSQATVIISEGSIEAAPGADSVALEITPLDPATLAKPPSGLELAGNAYEIVARYEPLGEPVEETTTGADQRVVLVYPAVAGEPEHDPVTMLHSSAGGRWERLETRDSGATQQAQVTFESFGYFVVARPSDAGGLSSSALGVVVLSVILLGL
ncbi:MAG TPA: hypothetical protein VIG64_14230, partial [Actinomycetota bacterium]